MDGTELFGKALIVMKLKQLVKESYVAGALDYCHRGEGLLREDVEEGVYHTEVWEEIEELTVEWLGEEND